MFLIGKAHIANKNALQQLAHDEPIKSVSLIKVLKFGVCIMHEVLVRECMCSAIVS